MKIKCNDCQELFSFVNKDGLCISCEIKRHNDLALKESVESVREDWHVEIDLPFKYDLCSFEKFEKKLQPKAYEILSNYNLIANHKSKSKSLIIYSHNQYGLGKTHLVCALANKIIDNYENPVFESHGRIISEPCPVIYTNETKLIANIKATYQKDYEGESEEKIYKKINEVKLLIIDDVGKVTPRDKSYLQSVYYRVIDTRYSNNMPIIIVTNLDLTELEMHIGGFCADRLVEMCGKDNIIKMTGESYRKRALK